MSRPHVLPSGYRVRPCALDRDLDAILAIDEASFTHPPSRESYEWQAAHSDVARLFVLEGPSGEIDGYCAAWLIFDEFHINSIAVSPGVRERGLGAALLAEVLEAASAEGARRATLEVRESNLAARRLYERQGFAVKARRTAYYRDPVEDALILWHEGPLGHTNAPARGRTGRLETPDSEC